MVGYKIDEIPFVAGASFPGDNVAKEVRKHAMVQRDQHCLRHLTH